MTHSPDTPDHGGGVDAAAQRFGGARPDWIDLSTGINPLPYPLPALSADAWTALPDAGAMQALETAARVFWDVPATAAVLAAPGASALIARLPFALQGERVEITAPTYNEHGRAYAAAGWGLGPGGAKVLVHPNNPDGRTWREEEAGAEICVIDESFCDVMPEASLIRLAARPGMVVLKSFGKFWGLAGLRLGFAIGDPAILARLEQMLGPWPVSGPALEIGAQALGDTAWAEATRARLAADATRLDALMGLPLVGGTTLFRLYDAGDAKALQEALARRRIWSRVFPYSDRWLRLGLPGPQDWPRLEAALREIRA
ncbi:threonine-phosphate decarboxylase [Cereibacter changlensis JA139]|uniref:Aminotransferase n=2 Tax=Cereibacter changlensis TaxID=402884 RepID=A0A2T4JVY3_9RHOB|nr:threonine-phosphate decarboxylase [Cereibacter changlensis]PTE22070.1 threonine-phosphate decarboxylase [Cereibacter changlensis JA139]PZX58698.1 L-threonine O-3-phosphate decarboxylase [Cereibacter changlensis]